MKNKKIITTLVISTLFLSLILTITPASAGAFHRVSGDLFIQDENGNVTNAPAGMEVKIIFDSGEETDLTSDTGHYEIDFVGYEYEDGIFWVNHGGTWIQPIGNPYVEISEITGYDIDLYIPPSVNHAPILTIKSPSNGATGININTDIKWSCTDPDGDPLTYDIYFSTDTNPTLKKPDHTSTTYDQGTMNYLTKYYWKIVAKDDKGATTEGPIWSFTTEDEFTGGGGGGGGGGGVVNMPPIADASASEKTGFVGIPVNFDGSESTDSDGTIIEYAWTFGDGKTGTGVTTTHTYTAEGVYSVTLTVKDNILAFDIDTFNVIISIPNSPPSAPVISGPTMGTKEESYDYTFKSIDTDDDDLSYNISWGDTETSTTTFYPNATEATASHSWDTAGVYTINAHAYDSKTVSGNTKYVVLIDAWWVKDIGYLLDYDANGVYEKFYSNSTDEETNTEQRNDGKYLIDEDGDGEWDWVYDIETDTLTAYVPAKEEEQDNTLWYVLILFIIIILIIIAYLASKRKKKPQETKPETNNNKNKNKKKK